MKKELNMWRAFSGVCSIIIVLLASWRGPQPTHAAELRSVIIPAPPAPPAVCAAPPAPPAPAASVDPENPFTAFGQRQEALWVSRLCAHETTFSGGQTNDCGGILQVLRNSGGGVGAVIRRTPRFFGGRTERAWARHLMPNQRYNPPSWPETWPGFSVYTAAWHNTYTRTVDYVTGQRELPCTGRPMHWLGWAPGDMRARHLHTEVLRDWRTVECGDTINEFFEHVPRSEQP